MNVTEHSMASAILAVITGQTCGESCWHAREEVCRCSCGGKNHGCLRRGGEQPGRVARIGGDMYELVSVVPGPSNGECWQDAFERERQAISEAIQDRFPGLDRWQYGEYREHKQLPVLSRKVSASHRKWSEVAAVPGACRLIWARPRGAAYAVKKDK